jgi:3-oxoadipyl-CoA thiolase
MKGTNEAVVVEAIRTPIGKYDGILRDIRPDDLASTVMREVVRKSGIDPSSLDDIYMGCSNQAGEDNRNIARMASLLAGFPDSVPAATVNRLCGSGLEAVGDAARAISTGEGKIIIAGGVESMTRAPLATLKPERAFQRGELKLVDTTIGWRFINPRWPKEYPPISMGETAENLAEKYAIGRKEQDGFAVESHRKAVRATEDGLLREEIVAVSTPQNVSGVIVDEGPRKDTSIELLGTLKPVFRQNGTVTAGNSSGINDGAAALLLMSRQRAEEEGLKPIANILGCATAGVHPSFMGLGPVPATRKLLERIGMRVEDFGIVELNEAFASQVLACFHEFPELSYRTLNPNGGAIALGHPIGCSGARIAVTLLHQMRRTHTKFGLATMCIGVGQGIAMAFELL